MADQAKNEKAKMEKPTYQLLFRLIGKLEKFKKSIIAYRVITLCWSFQYVTAFAISACASNWERLGKPFNPLLGETYELNK